MHESKIQNAVIFAVTYILYYVVDIYHYRIPAVSAHSLLPICTRREQQRANAKTSSSPVNIELALTTSFERPYRMIRNQ